MFGRQLKDALVEVGIGTDGLKMDTEFNTTLAFVHTYPNGDRDFSFYRKPGADMMLRTEDLDEELIRSCRLFHYGSLSMTDDGCLEATKEAIRIAKEAGAIISFDPNLREPLWDGDLDRAKERISYGISQCDVLKISDNEITWFSGKDSYDDGVAFLKEKYPNLKLILVSMGPEGSMAFLGDEKSVVKPFLNPDTIETTGAGDTFCACVLHYVLTHPELDYGEDGLTQMLTFANAAASIITTRKGALRVMPDRTEVEAYLKENI
jgi:fructokinase